MSSRIAGHLRGNFVGYIAVFIALSGTAYAVDGPLQGQDQVGSEDIINNEVKREDLGPDAVRTANVLDNELRGADIAADTLTGADIANTSSLGGAEISEDLLFNDDSLTAEDLAENAVGTTEVAPDSLLNFDLAPGSVTSSEILDGGVSSADLGGDSVGSSEVAPNALTSSDIGTDSVGSSEVADGTIRGIEVLDGTLGSADINESSVSGLLRCTNPATVRFGTICAGSNGVNQTFRGAVDRCAGFGLRLPATGEALLLAISSNAPGVGAGQGFWTANLAGDHVTAAFVTEEGEIGSAAISAVDKLDAVCVTEPSN